MKSRLLEFLLQFRLRRNSDFESYCEKSFMARFILLAIVLFIALTFVFIMLKGVLRRFIGTAPPPTKSAQDHVLFNSNDVIVMQGESARKDS